MKTKTLYSKDFNFFMLNQIALSISNNGNYFKFFSRLDGEVFKIIDDNKELSQDEIRIHCNLIHMDLKYYD